jgi:hypothetical protein
MPEICLAITLEIGRSYGDDDESMEMKRGKTCNTVVQRWRRKSKNEK